MHKLLVAWSWWVAGAACALAAAYIWMRYNFAPAEADDEE